MHQSTRSRPAPQPRIVADPAGLPLFADPDGQPPAWRVRYRLDSGEIRFSRIFYDHRSAKRWRRLLATGIDVIHAEVERL